MKFKIQNVEFNACIFPQSTLQSTAVSALMSVPPISHSGRCNYFRWDRAKCHQEFLKATSLRHVQLCVFFSFLFSSPLAGSFYQLILLTDCPQQFHYRKLACRGAAWSCCKGAAGEYHTSVCIPNGNDRTLVSRALLTVMSARDDVREAFEGRRHKLSDETLLLTGWTVAVSESTTKLNCSRN